MHEHELRLCEWWQIGEHEGGNAWSRVEQWCFGAERALRNINPAASALYRDAGYLVYFRQLP